MNSHVDPDFPEQTVPDIISQSELNDLVRDLNLGNSGRNLGFSATGMEFVTESC